MLRPRSSRARVQGPATALEPQMFDALPLAVQAGVWAMLGASSLLLGAAAAYIFKLPARVTGGVMALGCGILISAVAYDLILEGFEQGGMGAIMIGALVGSAAYTLANWLVSRSGGRHRKRSGQQQQTDGSGGLAIAIGSLLDGVPESVVLGTGLLAGGGVSPAMFAAIFLSNLPEGLSRATGMRKAGRSKTFVFGLWGGIAVLSGSAALAGATLLGDASPELLAMVNAVAAGALLTMVADTMIPEAVEGERGGTGLLVVLGLLAAFALSHAG